MVKGLLHAQPAGDTRGRLICAARALRYNVPRYKGGAESMGHCSGNLIDAAIVDQVLVPEDLPAGEYVVGFRWDCE